ncbi:MAG: phospholipid carrier-dependent glycosyltransferase [Actinomycetota bacterium]|nr:phospholipid carrier-dependent glycosyltransferase [Actinomycetota bacterium]
MHRSRIVAVVVPLLLVLAAGTARVVLLGHPDRIIFDETYYVEDARSYLDQGVEHGFAVHPPVGKWLIAAGIAVAGDEPFGWRISTAVAGTLLVLLTYLIGLRLLRWRGAAALAGLLAAVDGLLFVQSRTSMLDIFLAMFVALGAWLLLVDRDRSGLARRRDGRAMRTVGDRAVPAGGSVDEPPADDRTVAAGWATTVASDRSTTGGQTAAQQPPSDVAHVPRRGHAFRVAAGAAFGLAVATKWSALLALAAGVLVTAGWELAWRRRLTGQPTAMLGRLIASLAVAFVLVPAGVYVASYVPWLINYEHTTEGRDVCRGERPCQVSIPGRLAGLWRYQLAIANFHTDLDAEHPYRAPAYTWPVIGRPMVYYWENCDRQRAAGVATRTDEGELVEPDPCRVAPGNAGEIIALGNPGLWWVALGALVPLAAGAARRDGRAWFVVAFWGAQFLPWLVVSLPGVPFSRPLFFFYMTPIVPFLALAVAYGVVWLDETVERVATRRTVTLPRTSVTPGAVVGALVGLVAVGLFVYFYPVLAGVELPEAAVRQRWWFDAWV